MYYWSLQRVELLPLGPPVLQRHPTDAVRDGAHLSVRRRRKGVTAGGVVESVENPVHPVSDLPQLCLDVLDMIGFQ